MPTPRSVERLFCGGIRARGKRRFRVSTTDSDHALPIAPNLLARNPPWPRRTLSEPAI